MKNMFVEKAVVAASGEDHSTGCDGTCGCVVPCANCRGRHRLEIDGKAATGTVANAVIREGGFDQPLNGLNRVQW